VSLKLIHGSKYAYDRRACNMEWSVKRNVKLIIEKVMVKVSAPVCLSSLISCFALMITWRRMTSLLSSQSCVENRSARWLGFVTLAAEGCGTYITDCAESVHELSLEYFSEHQEKLAILQLFHRKKVPEVIWQKVASPSRTQIISEKNIIKGCLRYLFA